MRITPSRFTASRPLALALIALVALPIAGCARNRTKGDLPYVARDVGTLYSNAKLRLDQHRYKEAAALFDEVERQHPYSVWARRAQLMGAFSYYLNSDYTQAIQSAQRFLSIHPGSRDAPYAYYLVALCYYEQISDVTRDQKITQQAQDALGELVRRYPNTRYAADARLKIEREAPASLDLLALDAFSSDAIPMHLMTREAFAAYARILQPRGLLLVHISNRFLDLEPVVAALAAEGGWHSAKLYYQPPKQIAVASASQWIALTRDAGALTALTAGDSQWAPLTRQPGLSAWTDDYSTILPLLKWKP